MFLQCTYSDPRVVKKLGKMMSGYSETNPDLRINVAEDRSESETYPGASA